MAKHKEEEKPKGRNWNDEKRSEREGADDEEKNEGGKREKS